MCLWYTVISGDADFLCFYRFLVPTQSLTQKLKFHGSIPMSLVKVSTPSPVQRDAARFRSSKRHTPMKAIGAHQVQKSSITCTSSTMKTKYSLPCNDQCWLRLAAPGVNFDYTHSKAFSSSSFMVEYWIDGQYDFERAIKRELKLHACSQNVCRSRDPRGDFLQAVR